MTSPVTNNEIAMTVALPVVKPFVSAIIAEVLSYFMQIKLVDLQHFTSQFLAFSKSTE